MASNPWETFMTFTTRPEILGTFGVTADQQDFTAELTKIKALKPEVIYFGGLTPIGVRIRAQMEKIGLKALFQELFWKKLPGTRT